MKKNVGKKIRLMALLASLTLVLWGGVIACSSGSDDDDSNGGNTGTEDTKDKGDEQNANLPTAIKLIDFEGGEGNYEKTKRETEMKKSATDGIWTCELTIPRDWPNFNVVATVKGEEIWYKGGKLELNATLTMKDTGDNIYCEIGESNINSKFLVTVDFTGDEPTFKLELAQ